MSAAPSKAPAGPTVRPSTLAGGVVVEIPLDAPLVSEANARGHTIAKAGRVASQRASTAAVLRVLVGDPPTGPVRVVITRRAKRKLDSDNIHGACKSRRDGVADWMGINDRDPRVEWVVAQEIGDPAVRIEIVPTTPWSTGGVSSAVTHEGALDVVSLTLDRRTLAALHTRLGAVLAGTADAVAPLRVGTTRLRIFAQRTTEGA